MDIKQCGVVLHGVMRKIFAQLLEKNSLELVKAVWNLFLFSSINNYLPPLLRLITDYNYIIAIYLGRNVWRINIQVYCGNDCLI